MGPCKSFRSKMATGRIENGDANGNVNVAFTTLSPTANRAIRIAPKRKQMYAAQLELTVVAKR